MMTALKAYHEGNTERALAELAELCETHPEGSIFAVRGTLLFASDRFEEAESVCAAAARMPAVVPIRRQALRVALGAAVLRLRAKPPDAEQLRQRAIQYARELYADRDNLVPLWAFNGANWTWQLGERDLARLYVTEWERLAPQDVSGTQWQRAQIDFSDGHYYRAITAFKRVLAEKPPTMKPEEIEKRHERARNLLKRAEDGLRHQTKVLEPTN